MELTDAQLDALRICPSEPSWGVAGPFLNGDIIVTRGTQRPVRIHPNGSAEEFDFSPLPPPPQHQRCDPLDWQRIETAPRDGTAILGWHSNWEYPMPLCWERPLLDDGSHSGCQNAWVYCDWLQHKADLDGVNPTHWMPLPLPPQHKGKS